MVSENERMRITVRQNNTFGVMNTGVMLTVVMAS